MGREIKTFRVVYEIDVDADTAQKAAEQGAFMMRMLDLPPSLSVYPYKLDDESVWRPDYDNGHDFVWRPDYDNGTPPHPGSADVNLIHQANREHDIVDTAITKRELELLEKVQRGLPNKVIAYELSISECTVKVHMHNLMRKLKATNRTQVAFLANQVAAKATSFHRSELTPVLNGAAGSAGTKTSGIASSRGVRQEEHNR